MGRLRLWGAYLGAIWKHWKRVATGSVLAVAALIAGWVAVPIVTRVVAILLFTAGLWMAAYAAWRDEHLALDVVRAELRESNQRAGTWHTAEGLADWLRHTLGELERVEADLEAAPSGATSPGSPEFTQRSLAQDTLDAIHTEVLRQLGRHAPDKTPRWTEIVTLWHQRIMAEEIDQYSPMFLDLLIDVGGEMIVALREFLGEVPAA